MSSELPKNDDQKEIEETSPISEDEIYIADTNTFSDQEDESEEETVTGPAVDPTGTFSDWKRLNESGIREELKSVTDEDHIPPPKLDKDGFKILNPNPNVSLPLNIYSANKAVHTAIPLFTYLGNSCELLDALSHYDIIEKRKTKNRSTTGEHEESIAEAFPTCIPDQYFWKSQFIAGSNWTNDPVFGKEKLRMAAYRSDGIDARIQSDQDDYRLGIPVHIPLWHSGFHVRLRTPTTKQFAILDSIVASDRNIFGRRTTGAVFSGTRCYLENAIKDMFFDCLRQCNITNWTPAIIEEMLDGRDIQLIALALSASRFPKGYPNFEPCVEIESGCTEVKEKAINLINTLVVDTNRFTPEQIRHMADRNAKRTIDQVKKYQEDASWNAPKTVSVSSSISIKLKAPKLIKTINSGFTWAAEINAIVSKSIGDSSPTRNRQMLIENLISSSTLRSLSSHFDAFIIDEKETEVTDDNLEDLIDRIGDDREIVRRLELDIRDYNDANVVAFMALPRYHCSKCEAKLRIENPAKLEAYMKNPILVPQDAVTRFFTLRSLG